MSFIGKTKRLLKILQTKYIYHAAEDILYQSPFLHKKKNINDNQIMFTRGMAVLIFFHVEEYLNSFLKVYLRIRLYYIVPLHC